MKTENYTFFDLFTSQKISFSKSKVKVIEVLKEDSNNFYLFILADGTKVKVNTQEYEGFTSGLKS